jgi:hypothetical protein
VFPFTTLLTTHLLGHNYSGEKIDDTYTYCCKTVVFIILLLCVYRVRCLWAILIFHTSSVHELFTLSTYVSVANSWCAGGKGRLTYQCSQLMRSTVLLLIVSHIEISTYSTPLTVGERYAVISNADHVWLSHILVLRVCPYRIFYPSYGKLKSLEVSFAETYF